MMRGRMHFGKGIIDFHAHLIPGADDGAASLDEAVVIAKILSMLHVKAVVATPHYAPGTPCSGAAYIEHVRQSHSLLAEMLAWEKVPLTVYQGFEVKITEETMYSGNFGDLAIRGTECVLLEAPFSGDAKWLDELVYTLKVSGYVPILAHPERCQCLGGDTVRLERLAREGAVPQLNIGSFAGQYGSHVRGNAQAVLRRGLRTVLGSDIHNTSQIPLLSEGLRQIGKQLRGAEYVGTLYGAACSLIQAGRD
jgi:protein-tyrosine phosphatase